MLLGRSPPGSFRALHTSSRFRNSKRPSLTCPADGERLGSMLFALFSLFPECWSVGGWSLSLGIILPHSDTQGRLCGVPLRRFLSAHHYCSVGASPGTEHVVFLVGYDWFGDLKKQPTVPSCQIQVHWSHDVPPYSSAPLFKKTRKGICKLDDSRKKSDSKILLSSLQLHISYSPTFILTFAVFFTFQMTSDS